MYNNEPKVSHVTSKEFHKGGFPRSRNCYVNTYIYFTRVNKVEALYERPFVNENLQRATLNFYFYARPFIYTLRII